MVSGCAGMGVDGTQVLAETDHRTCMERGLSWPSDEYETCRYALAERRNHRDWQNLHLTRMPRLDQGPERPAEVYRPLPRETFRCRERHTEDGESWVDCTPFR